MDEEIMIEQARPMLQLGDKAPDFKAVTSHGPISLSDYKQEAQKRLSEGYGCKDWYFCKKNI